MITPDPVKAAIAAKAAVGAFLTGKEVLVTPQKRKARLAACAKCPDLDRDGQCAVCTCFVSLKSRLATEACPRGRWPQ